MRAIHWLAALALVPPMQGTAFAGPPYFTDDPEPTDVGHWEVYVFADATHTGGGYEGESGLDLNYGPVSNVQLTATLPLNYTDEDGGHAGAGDVELGVKYRFFQRENAGFAAAIFPRVILPTAASRFGSGRVQLLLPAWVQKDKGAWSLFGGGGYMINPGAGNRDYWLASAAITRTVSDRLSLGGEIAWRGPDTLGGPDYAALNVGGIYRLSAPLAILFSAGPGLTHAREGGEFNSYIALGIDF